MFKNYFRTALRNLGRNKVFSGINIVGLSLGLACCILIFLYTKDEVSFDRWQDRSDELWQLTCKIIPKGGPAEKYGLAGQLQGPAFARDIPEIRGLVRMDNNDENVVKKDNETFREKMSWVDSNFFTVFSFPLLHGDPARVLSDMHNLVLSEDMAKKYFGTTHAVGKRLEIELNGKFEPFVVSGVARRSPENSSIQYKMLLPYQLREKIDPENGWHMLSYSTFLLIKPGTNIPALEKKMDDVYHKYAGKEIEESQKSGVMTDTFRWGVRPFLAMHLDTEYRSDSKLGTSDPIYSWILSGIAVFILIIACINFVNLTVAQSLKRAKEIGIRKVIGGQRKQLIRQFLGESYLVCLVAFVLALILAELMLPVFNDLSNKRLAIGYLMDWKLVAGFVGLWLLTGLAAGAYPALVLSGFNPVQTLYNRTKLSGKNWLARVLIVVQFALASFLIVATLCIYSQFDYMTHKDLGYNDKNLLAVTVGKSRDTVMMQLFRNEFARVPGVEAVAPEMQGTWFTGSKANGKEFITKYEHIDGAYLSAIQAPLVAGRNFSPDFPADSTNSVLVNEAFVREAGWKSNGVGEVVNWLNGKARNLRVVGVVRDFHFESLKTKIRPQIFSVDSKLPFGKFVVRVNPQQAASAVKAVEKIYRSLVPYHPFVYDYMSDLNYKNYEKEAKWKQIISLSAIITIFISCIGLFGLTMLSAEKRFKEIGIRKVLGASVGSIVRLLSGNFVSLVLLANVIAFPVAWWVLQSWLNNFAYRIPMHWWLFGLAGAIALVIALVTVSLQALRAATANPVKSLRSE